MNKLVRILSAVVLSIISLAATAQPKVVNWQGKSSLVEDNIYRIEITGEIGEGWHIYDMGPYGVGGPNATSISFDLGENVETSGIVEIIGERKTLFDEIFNMNIGYYEGSISFTQDFKLSGKSSSIGVTIEYMACNDESCIPPTEEEFTFTIGEGTVAGTGIAVTDTGAGTSSNIWALIIEAILWGLAALLTPCVFPMVPMTVSYFLKGEGGAAKGRLRAALYGIFIVALYTLPIAIIIMITRIAGGDAVTADIFNWLATHWLPNIIFFIVFMIFAASFFGAFEIVLPSWIVNKSDAKADTKGFVGIFFLALTLVLVSFSCTGPIVGSVLIKSTSGEFWTPIITMLAFSIAFALPFTIFALFPSILKKLPKSGGWLNTVKIVIAFIEVALGLKFLSTADQTYHWGILDREIYLAIWIVVFTLLGFYLLGKIKFAHDDEVTHIDVGRLALVIAVFSFVVYLIPGMWGAPLKALSGYLPPMSTQDFVIDKYKPENMSTINLRQDAPKYSDFLHLPHGLNGFFDLDEAKAYANEVDKPIFLDFTGHGCVNCREMEARVWADPRVLEILRDEYVICALYTDDKKTVDEKDWVATDNGKVLKGLGKINSHYALKTYGVNAQPYYVIIGRDGKPLVEPRGYNLDIEAFIKFLEAGKAAY